MTNEELIIKYQPQVDAITALHQEEIRQIEAEGAELKKEGEEKFKLDLKVDWSDQKVAFDLPQVKMTTQVFKLDVPQFTMRDQEFIFHTPSTRMVPRKIGKYPVFYWNKIVWKDIIIDVPEVFMQEQKIIVGIPEIKIDTVEIKLDIPEIEMGQVELILKVPEFRLGDVSIYIPIDDEDMKQRVKSIQARGEVLAQKMNDEVKMVAQQMEAEAKNIALQEYAQKLATANSGISPDYLKKFDEAIAAIDASLEKLSNLSPHLSKDDQRLITDLQLERANWLTRKAEAIAASSQSVQNSATQGESILLASVNSGVATA